MNGNDKPSKLAQTIRDIWNVRGLRHYIDRLQDQRAVVAFIKLPHGYGSRSDFEALGRHHRAELESLRRIHMTDETWATAVGYYELARRSREKTTS